MKNKQILETLQLQQLSEEEKAKRHILGRLYGPIATCKEGTRNGRHYNKDLWEKALSDELFAEKLKTKSLFLELGHPAEERDTDMTKVCACIPEMPKIVEGDLYAYVDILDTPNGRLLKTFCDYGFVPGISSRGTGDVMANDDVDPETFFLETWDIVQLPAVKKARLAMCESYNGKSLKHVLNESLEKANDKDKAIMKEALDNLDIKLDIKEEKVQDVAKDAEKLAEAPELKNIPWAAEENPLMENKESGIEECAAIKEELPGVESGDIKGDSHAEESKVKKVEEPVEAIDDGMKETLESLKEMIRQKDLLESEIKTLRNEKAVSDAEVKKLQEDVEKYKSSFARVSELASKSGEFEKENKSLKEQLIEKDTKINDLQSKAADTRKLTESVNSGALKVKSLTEKLDAMQKDLTASEKKLEEQKIQSSKKINEGLALAKEYKTKCSVILNRYIESKANNLGVKASDILNRLDESYTLDDIDTVCDELLDEDISIISSLPFGGNNRKLKESIETEQSEEVDDDIKDLLEFAGLDK